MGRSRRRSGGDGSLWTTLRGRSGRSRRRSGGDGSLWTTLRGRSGRSQRRSGGSSGVPSATPVGLRRVSMMGVRPSATSEWCGRPPLAPEGVPHVARGRPAALVEVPPGAPCRPAELEEDPPEPSGARRIGPQSLQAPQGAAPRAPWCPRELPPEPAGSPGSCPQSPLRQGDECARYFLLCSDAVPIPGERRARNPG